jgi:two-component system response regulator FixJ
MRIAVAGKSVVEERDAVARISSLTPRRRAVFEGILAGEPNKVIAYRLGISRRTVENHRARMMEDLGARNVLDVIRLGFQAKEDQRREQRVAPSVPHDISKTAPE